MTFSVVIPLYNKAREIEATVRSALAQTVQPAEIIVVDDGSTDGGAEIVRGIASPLVKLISQPNAGVCAARNRAIAEAKGEYIALLDGDDCWEAGFLAEIAALIAEFPACGLYATAFNIIAPDGIFPAPCPAERGIVKDFFRESAHRYIAIPSASVIPRAVFADVGDFPEGMKIGEDLYMWIKIARKYPVCFSPERLVAYSKVASNRSAAGYTPEKTRYSFEELYDPAQSTDYNEFVARAALGKALIISTRGGTKEAARAAKFFAYTCTYRSTLWKIRILNRLPRRWRGTVMAWYNALAWKIAKKGL